MCSSSMGITLHPLKLCNGIVQIEKRHHSLSFQFVKLLSILASVRHPRASYRVNIQTPWNRTGLFRVRDGVHLLRLNVFAADTHHYSMLTRTASEIPRRENKRHRARSASRFWQVPSFGSVGYGVGEMPPVQRTVSDLRSRAEGKETVPFIF